MKAWIENECIRDLCDGDPFERFHPDVAVFYDTDVPVDSAPGDGWIDGQLVKREMPNLAPPPLVPMWSVSDVRAKLTLAERVRWDNDSSPFIRTAKIELAEPRTQEAVQEVLQMLVESNDISQSSMDRILA